MQQKHLNTSMSSSSSHCMSTIANSTNPKGVVVSVFRVDLGWSWSFCTTVIYFVEHESILLCILNNYIHISMYTHFCLFILYSVTFND